MPNGHRFDNAAYQAAKAKKSAAKADAKANSNKPAQKGDVMAMTSGE